MRAWRSLCALVRGAVSTRIERLSNVGRVHPLLRRWPPPAGTVMQPGCRCRTRECDHSATMQSSAIRGTARGHNQLITTCAMARRYAQMLVRIR